MHRSPTGARVSARCQRTISRSFEECVRERVPSSPCTFARARRPARGAAPTPMRAATVPAGLVRQKIGGAYIEAMTPLDDFVVKDGRLCAVDIGDPLRPGARRRRRATRRSRRRRRVSHDRRRRFGVLRSAAQCTFATRRVSWACFESSADGVVRHTGSFTRVQTAAQPGSPAFVELDRDRTRLLRRDDCPRHGAGDGDAGRTDRAHDDVVRVPAARCRRGRHGADGGGRCESARRDGPAGGWPVRTVDGASARSRASSVVALKLVARGEAEWTQPELAGSLHRGAVEELFS